MNLRTGAALLLLAGFGAFLAYLALSPGPAGGEPNPPPARMVRSKDCASCHPEVYAEWKRSWHGKSWFDPLVRAPDQSDNFKKKDCIPCHAPRPIFEAGIEPGQRVVERQSNRQDGVDCLSCHKLPSGGVAAPTRGARGPCGPKYSPRLSKADLCTPCHNQHNTVDEWAASPPRLKGTGCAHCHFPEKERPGRRGRPPRKGRSHLLASWRNENLDREALTLKKEIVTEGGEKGKEKGKKKRLRITLVNDKTAHNVPADSRNRALDLVLTFFDAGGAPFPAAEGKRGFGQEKGTYRKRFRNPYRSEVGKKNTQIVSGTEAVLEAPIPPGAKRARIELLYKLNPYSPDEKALRILKEDLDL